MGNCFNKEPKQTQTTPTTTPPATTTPPPATSTPTPATTEICDSPRDIDDEVISPSPPRPRTGGGPMGRGRPYISDNGGHTPNVSEKSQVTWNVPGAISPNLTNLTQEERMVQANKWTEAGKSEHASIASFALFSQKLLAIGAPAHLITEALQCAQEEVNHASFAFTLASAFAGYTISPSSYPTHTMTVAPELLKIIEDTIREGCVEETVSALVARRELAEESDPAIRVALSQVVDDEAHHAAFAWKVVRWAIEREGQTDKKVIEMVERIITPEELEKIGEGRYSNEDIELLCAFKRMLLAHYNKEERAVGCGISEKNNVVGEQVMQVVC